MPLDKDFIAGHDAILEMIEILQNTPHGKREVIAGYLCAFTEKLKDGLTVPLDTGIVIPPISTIGKIKEANDSRNKCES